ncbi:adenosylcobinamide-GDP ribazoletransferase [Gordonia shandongensis]|uniref:adenosylcobinamide-GDP ribazoletransferase n=1 Tax=Gordonia shandongensis TaxID=376351 RepID=UPI0003F6DD17|nr:adenosylcobinamide-GDP ribazoletransferase [Gordonia shandongensis]
MTGRLLRAAGGVRDAVAWITVIPVPRGSDDFDRARGGAAISAVPLVGAALGAAVAAGTFGLSHTSLPTALIGVLTVAVLALATRGMHLDGLADTADGLGSYGDPARVRTIMRTGDLGPFGAATLLLVLITQAAAYTALAADHRWPAIALAVFAGRAAVPVACRTTLPPANDDGFGALVAGTQRAGAAVWVVVLVGAAAVLGVQPAVVALVALVGAWAFTRHCARRAGGMTGDVVGATVELVTAVVAVGLLV